MCCAILQVGINSAGIEYSAISLLSSLLLLYLAFALNKFKLDKRVGRVCLLMYAVFLILASLIELNAFFRVNLPTCGRWILQDAECSCKCYAIMSVSFLHYSFLHGIIRKYIFIQSCGDWLVTIGRSQRWIIL